MKPLEIIIAIIQRDGKYLVAQRPPEKAYGGYWEFPGGKREAGESEFEALQRECREELGIAVRKARPVFSWRHCYGDNTLRLSAWQVDAYAGEAYGAERQALQWLWPAEFGGYRFPAANGILMKALQLPDCYAITPEIEEGRDFYAELDRLLASGITLLQFRAKTLASEHYRQHAAEVAARCRRAGVTLLLNGDPRQVAGVTDVGLHLDAQRLMQLRERPIATERWLAASCHNEAEIRQAERIGADFIVLSPVLATQSHPHSAPLGWQELARLVEQANVPVYALGGMTRAHLPMAQQHGCQGIAAISAFWPRVGG